MQIVNIIIIFIFLLGIYIGYQKGVIKQLSDFLILFITSILASFISDKLFSILYKYLPFFNLSGKSEGLKSINIILWKLIIYVLCVLILILIIRQILIKTKLYDKIINSMVDISLLNKILGMIISLPLVLILIFNISLFLLSPNFNLKQLNDSKVISTIMIKTPVLSWQNKNLYNNQKYIIKRINKKDNTKKNLKKVNNDIVNNMMETGFVNKSIIDNLNKENKLLGTRN